MYGATAVGSGCCTVEGYGSNGQNVEGGGWLPERV